MTGLPSTQNQRGSQSSHLNVHPNPETFAHPKPRKKNIIIIIIRRIIIIIIIIIINNSSNNNKNNNNNTKLLQSRHKTPRLTSLPSCSTSDGSRGLGRFRA